MARAKRTARAEARRRYRATIADSPDAGAAEGADGTVETERSDVRGRPGPRRASEAPERPSILAAFRSSFRPLDLRGDLRALPRLLMSKAFLIPLDLSGLSFVLVLLAPSAFTVFFYQYFSYQFPVAAVFATGFFAARAGWLLGALVAVGSVLFQLPQFDIPASELLAGLLVQAIYGAFFGAAAAWYRRFLNRANPNRMAGGRQPTTSRRPDGKIPRKQTARPMLARRR